MDSQPDRIPRAWHILACAALVILTVIFTWPLLAELSTSVIGPFRGDNFEYVWKMWWVPHALFERGISPFFNPDMAVPTGYALAYGEITPAHTFLYASITLLVGEIAAYNLTILASFILTGWFTYGLSLRLLARLDLTDVLRFTGALLASFAFTFCAYRMARIAGHLPLIDTQWLVLTFWALDRWLETRRISDALLIGLAVALAGLSTWYYLFMLGLIVPVYALTFLGRRAFRATFSGRKTWLGILAAGELCAILIAPFLLPYIAMAREGTAAIPVDDAAFWSASLTDYLVPNPRHPIWGGAVQSIVWPIPETDMPYEFLLSVGWITLILALIACRRARGPSFRAWKWTIAVAMLFSLGPLLNISRLVTPLPLPALLLRELIPFAEGVRSWGRFAIVAMLGFSLLAAGGMGLLLVRRSQRAQWAVSALVCGLVLFGAWPGGAELVKVGPREVDTWLAAQPDPSPIMEYPLDVALSGPAVLATRYHQKPVVFGYGTYFPYLFRERYPQLAEFPGDAALDLLEAWGVRTILLHTNALNPGDFTLAEVEAQPRLTIIRAFGDTLALELQP